MDAADTSASQDRRQRARAEASVWIVRLHGAHRSPELEAGFRRWLAANPDNAAEFERVTAESLGSALRRASALFRNRRIWTELQQNGMAVDVSWVDRASNYADLYRQLVKTRQVAPT